MPIMAQETGTDFEQPTPGTTQAVCVFIHDIGIQENNFSGETKRAHKIIMAFELAQKRTIGENAGKPFILSSFYTLSLHEKAALRKDLEAWRGKKFTPQELKGFDVETVKGANCLLSIVATENGKRKINGVMALPTGMPTITASLTEPPDKYIEWIEKEKSKQIKPEPTTEIIQAEPTDDTTPPF